MNSCWFYKFIVGIMGYEHCFKFLRAHKNCFKNKNCACYTFDIWYFICKEFCTKSEGLDSYNSLYDIVCKQNFYLIMIYYSHIDYTTMVCFLLSSVSMCLLFCFYVETEFFTKKITLVHSEKIRYYA